MLLSHISTESQVLEKSEMMPWIEISNGQLWTLGGCVPFSPASAGEATFGIRSPTVSVKRFARFELVHGRSHLEF
jgi:hypothetical protein